MTVSSIPAEVDLEQVDNYSLLSYAELALERGDVAMCVKLLNNLKGESIIRNLKWFQIRINCKS